MSTVDNSIIKYKNWQHFFNKKFSGKVQHAPWYFRQLSRAAANNGCAALLKGEAYVIAFRSLDEWRQIYDISLRRSATLRTSLPPPPPPIFWYLMSMSTAVVMSSTLRSVCVPASQRASSVSLGSQMWVALVDGGPRRFSAMVALRTTNGSLLLAQMWVSVSVPKSSVAVPWVDDILTGGQTT